MEYIEFTALCHKVLKFPMFCLVSWKLEWIINLLIEGTLNNINVLFNISPLKIKSFIKVILIVSGAIKITPNIYIQETVRK